MAENSKTLSMLLIEDQASIASNIAEYMEEKGHTMDFATQGQHGLALALENSYDLIILDLNLPKLDGLSLCQCLRSKAERHIPVIMLTARDSIEDKVAGFDAGTDDYLTKPFALQELEVRCLALSRRHTLQTNSLICIGDLKIDRATQKVYRDKTLLDINTMGFKILKVLAESYPQIVTKSELTRKLWGDEPTESDALRSHIYQLRNCLDKPYEFSMLKTVHGVGFVLETDDE